MHAGMGMAAVMRAAALRPAWTAGVPLTGTTLHARNPTEPFALTHPEPLHPKPYSRSPKLGNPIASILKSNARGIPALIVLNPVSNFLGFTICIILKTFTGMLSSNFGSHACREECSRARNLAKAPAAAVQGRFLGPSVWGLHSRNSDSADEVCVFG